MLVDNGSILIHCRSKYCDFPGKLFQYPRDFTAAQLYQARTMVLQTTEAVEELRQSHGKRQVVICTDTHLVTGVTAYIRDILEAEPDIYEDCGGRPVYGFFGFVWRRSGGEKEGYPAQLIKGFPSLASIGRLIQNHVLPKWEVRYWEEEQGAAYGERVEFDLFPAFLPGALQDMPGPEKGTAGCNRGTSELNSGLLSDSLSANQERILLKIYPGVLNDVMLCRTLEAAVYGGAPVSCCTGFPSLNSAGRSAFMNVSCAGREEGKILVKQRKRKKR